MKYKLLRKAYSNFRKLRDENKFKHDLKKFKYLINKTSNEFSDLQIELFPCLGEDTEYTEFDAHYFYHPAWAFRKLLEINPKVHYDISSILYFAGMVSAIIPIKYFDYRPAKVELTNLSSGKADLLSLPFPDNSIESLSCMHTIEHIGLGRYGDPINPRGDVEAISELKRVVKKNGNLLIAVPVGKPKIMFNAHRIYSFNQIIQLFEGFILKEFSLITDDKKFILNASEALSDSQNYGCGCFWLNKNY